ncbi:MAG: thioredoxin domain-containing protein [Pirellulaceae bacterium]
MKRKAFPCGLILLWIVIAGCEPSAEPGGEVSPERNAFPQSEDSATTPPSETVPSAASEDTPLDAVPVELTLANWEQIEAEIQASDKPVVVDIWSTSCLPCMKEFPGLVKIHNELGDKVRCISVNIDYIGLKSSLRKAYATRCMNFCKAKMQR